MAVFLVAAAIGPYAVLSYVRHLPGGIEAIHFETCALVVVMLYLLAVSGQGGQKPGTEDYQQTHACDINAL